MRYRDRLLIAVAATGLLSSAAWAQSAPSAVVSAGEADAAAGDIIVTARKRSENLRDVPITIAAISGGDLAAARITQIAGLMTRVPSLTMTVGSNAPFAQIRGLGTGNNQSFDQAVGKFIDNVSFGRDQDLRVPIFDVERVEVLKGPQVLLYGNSSTAGALNITTRKPGDRFEADGSIAYEFKGRQVTAQGGVSLPLGEGIGLRISGLYDDLNRGHVYNLLTDERVPTRRDYAGRAILAIGSGSDLRLTLKAEHDHVRSRGNGAELFIPPAFGPSPFPESDIDGVTAIDGNVAPFFQDDFYALNNTTYQGDINYDAAGGTFTSTSAYRTSKYAGATTAFTPIPLANAFLSYKYRQFSQELRYSGTFDAVDLIVGGFYQHEKISSLAAISFNVAAVGIPAPPFAANFVFGERTDSTSGFADLTWNITPALSLEAGARLTRVVRHAEQAVVTGTIVPNKTLSTGINSLAPEPAFGPLYQGFFGSAPHAFTGLRYRDTFFQPQVVLQYKLSEDANLYAKYVKGDKAGGFDSNYPGSPTGNNPADDLFASESARSFELGVKGVSADNRLSYAAALFNTTFRNLQTNAFVASSATSLATNVGKARTRGFEAELGYRPAHGLRLHASLTYADAKYLDFPGAQCTIAQNVATGPGCLQDLSGAPTVFSSKWSGSAGIDYEQPVGDLILSGGVLVVARSRYNPSTNNEPFLDQHGYAQIDAHVDLKADDGIWSLSLFGRNLTNQHYYEFGDAVPLLTTAVTVYRARGRQIGLRAGFKL